MGNTLIAALQNNYVGEGISTQLIEGIDSGNEYEEWLPGNEIKLWVITWKEFTRNQGAFRLIQKSVKYGNCFHCFTPLPLGMGCTFCRFGAGAVSLTLYFVNSESALQCESHAAPPAWFTDRYKPCHPFQLGLNIRDEGTPPLFDELYFKEEHGPFPKYSTSAGLWKPIALQKLIDHIFKMELVDYMGPPSYFEEYIRRATNANDCDIYDCVNKRRTKFRPEDWGRLLTLRELEGYIAPSELYHHPGQEEHEMDEEANQA